ncbi:ribonuclease H-like domain-containing protein [Candidatus Amarolinea dominans]|uniref:ribonuclease H-like domain-containing protein n=1 Tax=Candidatus Amarolinea dominans TaxID=3140696 RepID=UPI001DF81EA6|nr:ribonuclease H-like domain-containing protein [Anaerolineae bacterium]
MQPRASFLQRSRFDLPLLTNRFIMHRQTPRLTTAPHLDLLHPARRVWRQRLPSCALSSLETQILGLRRDQADVPGWLIPSLYFQYLQTGDAQDLVGVFYHNLEDILSMVTLAATLTRLLADPWAGETIHALDMAALGYTYDQAGRPAEAERAYRDALSHPLPDDVRLQTYSRLGQLLKRLQRLSEAAETWQDWITHVTRSANVKDLEPYVELAKYHEWHANDCTAALMWTRWGEHEVEAWPRSPARRKLAGLQIGMACNGAAGAKKERRSETDRNTRSCRPPCAQLSLPRISLICTNLGPFVSIRVIRGIRGKNPPGFLPRISLICTNQASVFVSIRAIRGRKSGRWSP